MVVSLRSLLHYHPLLLPLGMLISPCVSGLALLWKECFWPKKPCISSLLIRNSLLVHWISGPGKITGEPLSWDPLPGSLMLLPGRRSKGTEKTMVKAEVQCVWSFCCLPFSVFHETQENNDSPLFWIQMWVNFHKKNIQVSTNIIFLTPSGEVVQVLKWSQDCLPSPHNRTILFL